MVIGADDPLAEVLAEPVALVLADELLLLLLHAARTPTESATAPSATAFLENQGRLALTPGSSFLIAHFSSESNPTNLRGPLSRVIPAGFTCRATNAAKGTAPCPAQAQGGWITIVCMRDWPAACEFVNLKCLISY